MSLMQVLGRRVHVVDIGDLRPAGPHEGLGVDAVLVRGEWHRVPEKPTRGRVVWWMDQVPPEISPSDQRWPQLVLSADPAVVDACRAQGLRSRISPLAEEEPESAPVPPFVRERVRRARGLGAGLLVHDAHNRWTWNEDIPVDKDSVSTALAAAAAAYLSGEEFIVRALSWGCPVVAPQELIDRVGAVAGQQVLPDDGTDPVTQLRRLVEDPRLTAALSREGRARYETAHSLMACADDVLRALGLAPRWPPSALELRLDELDARRGGVQRRRFDEMVSPIVTGAH